MIWLAAVPASAATGVNQQVSYQARLLDSTGAVVADGTYNMEFKIYQNGDGVVGGGDETIKWTETRTGGNKVTVKNGYFSVMLGSVTSFGTSVDWNQDTLWLSTNIGGTGTPTWDGEMSPFRRFGSAAYALNADRLDGLSAADFLQLAPASVQSDSTTNTSISVNKTGASGNILQLQKNSANVLTVANDGGVTIGVADSTGSLFVLDIKNDTSTDPSGTEGAMYYNDIANKFRCYQNTGWTDCIGTGGGGGSPGGSDTQIQYNNAGSFGGDADFVWSSTGNTLTLGGTDTGIIMKGITNEPAAPASGNIQVYSKDIAGRMMLKWKGPSGLDQVVQPGMFFSAVRMLIPNGNNSVTTWGLPNTVVGTLTAPTFATTNMKTSVNRIRIVSASTANSASEMRAAVNQVWRGNAAGLGGFFYSATFAVNSTTANQRTFVGLANTTGAISASSAPSSLTNIVGVGWDSADTTLQLMYNDGSGTATKVNLGANFPANNTAAVYEITLFAPANGSNITYRVKRLDTDVVSNGTISTDLPSNTTFLTRHEYMNNGGTAAAVDLEVMRVYLESDY